MEKSKSKISYSIIRYSPDTIRGEIINTGVIIYNFDEKQIKYSILDEDSQKIRAVTDNKTDMETYKSYKDVLKYYLKESGKDISGMVGNISIASYYDESFLEKMYLTYKNYSLYLSEPNIAYTKDVDKFMQVILNRYVGEKNVNKEITTMTAKKYMKKIFQETDLLGKKVRADIILNPIEGLEDLQIKVDFCFKNGVWNYMQTIPNQHTPTKNTEWFAKTQLLLDTQANKDIKIHLLYKDSELIKDKSTHNLIKYLRTSNEKIQAVDVDKKANVDRLCNYIRDEAEIIDEAS